MTLAVVNLVLAAYMTGVIWVVQVVHYPLFAAVPAAAWPPYAAAHQRRITRVVAAPMLAQLVVGIALVVDEPSVATAASLALAALAFGVTGLVFAPLHGRLTARHDRAAIDRLVARNWIRTLTWTAQTAVAAALVI